MEVEEPFNPLNKKNLGFSVAEALLEKQPVALPPASFNGAGVYAIYYLGNFPLYRPITDANRDNKFDWPIYVGKAVPEGARKGGFGLGALPGRVLYRRLDEHAKSIKSVSNLVLSDFQCRFITVDDIWIPLGESLLIEMFSPLWNRALDGFGNHPPGKGRELQRSSPWDVLHPGRSWAARLPPGIDDVEIQKRVKVFLSEEVKRRAHKPPRHS